MVPIAAGQAWPVRDQILNLGMNKKAWMDAEMANGTMFGASKETPHRFIDPTVLDVDAGFDLAPTMPPWPAVAAGARRPVIALLDSGVREHPMLPKTTPDDPFLLRTDDAVFTRPWTSPLPPAAAPGPAAPDDADKAVGHATFIAGIIRRTAPAARVIDVRVMADNGRVKESTVVDALEWLHEQRRAGRPVDVVCMAFGRRPGDDSDLGILVEFEAKVRGLVDDGVRVVASPGNDHTDVAIFPAAFRASTAVGVGSGKFHASFSNYGDWVDENLDVVDLVSILPPDRWASWRGTSFAAGTRAAQFAQNLPAPGHVV